MAVALKEPYILTHGFSKHITGSVVVIDRFVACLKRQVVRHAQTQLEWQLRDYKTRPGFMASKGAVVSGALMEVIEDLVDGVLQHAVVPEDEPGRETVYYVPQGRVFDTRTRVQRGILFYPIVTVVLAQTPTDSVRRLVSAHAASPLRPGVVQSACDLLSRSFKPGERRLLVHAPNADNADEEDTVAANAILWSRTSAMADVARSQDTAVHGGMLRHGAHMERLKDEVASRPGRWALRHVCMARVASEAPPAIHPDGSLDGNM